MKNPGISNFRKRIVDNMARQVEPHKPFQEQVNPTNLKISNQKSRYQLKFGSEYRNFLEARDQVLEHPFSFEYNLEDQTKIQEGEEFLLSQLYRQIKNNTKRFLSQSSSNVLSAGFKFLLDKNLEEKQSAEFTAKNLMLNTQAIFRETVAAISSHSAFNGKVKINIEELRMDLILEIDNILQNILVNLADGYPQAAASGGTPRMREIINQVNRVEDEENDFIFANGIKISDYLDESKEPNSSYLKEPRSDSNYTEFIMEVVNAAIEVTQNNAQDHKERTIFQKFTGFSQNMFWINQQKQYQEILNKVSKGERVEENNRKLKAVSQKFSHLLSNKQEQEVSQCQQINKLWSGSEDGIVDIQNKKMFAVGQKIPSTVKPFKKQELKAKHFSAKHSSIIRILTKWAGYLQEIFENADKMVKQRKYPFKDVLNNIYIVKQGSGGTQKLADQLKIQFSEVKKKFKRILMNSYEVIGKFMGQTQPQEFVSSVNRYNQTRKVSSKINSVLATLMLQYTNILIHHLLKAGKDIKIEMSHVDIYRCNINLVVFRVSDIMRSKLQCSESGFISLLKTMYLLENNDSMKGKFKLIRIKNKLDDPANNIMINYLFMGKVQCELQLSIQEAKGKEKSYFTFSHFVYELTRGMFGSIAECAIMISQLDPMISGSSGSCYQQKMKGIKIEQWRKLKVELAEQNEGQNKENSDTFFECTRCKKLIVDERTYNIFPNTKICYTCILENEDPFSFLSSELKTIFLKPNLIPIRNYQTLNSLISEKYLLEFTEFGQLKLGVIMHKPSQMKTYSLQLNSSVLNRFNKPHFDFNSLSYTDITKIIKKSTSNPRYRFRMTFLFEDTKSIPDQILNLISLKRDQLKRVPSLLQDFSEFRMQKIIVKSIKFKVQIIKATKQQWNILHQVCTNLVALLQGGNLYVLKYNKLRNLDIANIKQLVLPKIDIETIPYWIKYCQKLLKLELVDNKLKEIQKQQLPCSLTHLNLQGNRLTSIDISDLRELTLIDLSRNMLTTLNINNSLKLTTLYLSSNKFTTFDFTANNNIIFLEMTNNRLVDLNISQNNIIEKLILGNNQLKQFDFDKFSRIELLSLNANQFTTLDLKNNQSIIQITMRDNPLTTFSMGKNNSLKILNLHSNQLTSFDIGINNKLQRLVISNNQLTHVSLGNNTSLRELIMHMNHSLSSIDYLPPSVQAVLADREAIINYDFSLLPQLTVLSVFGVQQGDKQLLQTLDKKVRLTMY